MKAWLMVLFYVVLGCGAGRLPTGYLGQEQRNKHQIDHGLIYSTHRDWQGSRFYRISLDTGFVGPIFVLVDTLGYGCVVPGAVWALNPPYSACPRWRVPR